MPKDPAPSAPRASHSLPAKPYTRPQQKPLVERIEKPKLVKRITTTPEHTPIAKQLPLINFKKHTPKDLAGIFRPKLTAVAARLQIIARLDNKFLDTVPPAQFQGLQRIVEKVDVLLEQLDERIPFIAHAELQTLDWGLKRIGQVSFKSLRRNVRHVVLELYRIERDYCFDWI